MLKWFESLSLLLTFKVVIVIFKNKLPKFLFNFLKKSNLKIVYLYFFNWCPENRIWIVLGTTYFWLTGNCTITIIVHFTIFFTDIIIAHFNDVASCIFISILVWYLVIVLVRIICFIILIVCFGIYIFRRIVFGVLIGISR